MITFFTVPKPFSGHIGTIQRNAIQSWLNVSPEVEVMLFGDEDGIVEMSAEPRVRHFDGVRKTSLGTPYLSDVFQIAQEEAKNEIVCFVNADIIFLKDVIECVRGMTSADFLLVGTRYNTDIAESISFEEKGAEERVKSQVSFEESNGLSGSDFFIFPRNKSYQKIPDFVIGRPSWDNWMFLNAHLCGIPMIDTSRAVLCVHQNHDYSHVPQKRGASRWDGPEGDYNKLLYYRDYLERSEAARKTYKSEYDAIIRSGEFPDTKLIRKLDQWLPVPMLALYDATHYVLRDRGVHPYRRRLFSKMEFTLFCERSALKRPERKWYNRIIKRMRKAFFGRAKAERQIVAQRLNGEELRESFKL